MCPKRPCDRSAWVPTYVKANASRASEELMELIGMCDRIIIMKDGKISGQLDRDKNLDENGLISMMV